MNIVQRKAYLNINGFTKHKANKRGTTIIFSRKHTTDASVRVVVDSGIDSNTGRITTPINAKLVFINRDNHWRDITKTSSAWTDLEVLVKKAEDQINFVPICKQCKAKKFTAKSGKVVCANACWVTWSGKAKKKTANKANKSVKNNPTPPPYVVSTSENPQDPNYQNNVLAKNPRVGSWPREAAATQVKKTERYLLDVEPGDLVTVKEIRGDKVLKSYKGKILGIIMAVNAEAVKVSWTSNTSSVDNFMLPRYRSYYYSKYQTAEMVFEVLSRKVEWKQE